MRSSSAGVIPLHTRAEYPPMKLTPTFLAALSRVSASLTKSSVVLHTEPPTNAIGVTEILLCTTGTPYISEIFSPVATRCFAFVVIFLYILLQVSSTSAPTQSRRLIPIVMVLTSRFILETIAFVSKTSFILIISFLRLYIIIVIRFCALIQILIHAVS